MYIAVTYIGSRYVPGEIISEDTPKEKLDWLKRAGAIREAAPDPEAPVTAEAPEDKGPEAQAPDPEPDDPETEAPEDKGPEAQAPDPEPDDPETEAPEDEIDEDAEAPEIDVMDGVVAAEKEEPRKPAKTAARKPAAKAAKGGKTK